jgi:PIN domain nuclease of toxin-antitoxin system
MFVADTHAVVHYAQGKNSKLGRKALRLFRQADGGNAVIHVPTVVLWEIAELMTADLIDLHCRFDHWYRDLDGSRGFAIEPLLPEDVNEARHLPFPDPFDCLIAGTAIRLGVPLVTRDRSIIDSHLLETVW